MDIINLNSFLEFGYFLDYKFPDYSVDFSRTDKLKYKNVDEELVEMLEASRQYENNVEMVTTLRGLMMRTINMGK